MKHGQLRAGAMLTKYRLLQDAPGCDRYVELLQAGRKREDSVEVARVAIEVEDGEAGQAGEIDL